jgi:hypothetical protein
MLKGVPQGNRAQPGWWAKAKQAHQRTRVLQYPNRDLDSDKLLAGASRGFTEKLDTATLQEVKIRF